VSTDPQDDDGAIDEIITLDVAELDLTDLDARLKRVSTATSDPYHVC
jgi:hypothetical protein